MHQKENNRYAPPNIPEEVGIPANAQYSAKARPLPIQRAFAWFGAAWALFRQRAGWWFGLALAWTVLSSVSAAAAWAFVPAAVSFFPAVHDFSVVFAMAGVAYAAERMERQARIDWRAGLAALMRCAGALALLGLLNAVFGQFLFGAEKALAGYAAKMQFKSPQSPLRAVADLMIYWGWLLFILAYLLPNGAAPILAVCRKMGAVRAWAAGWRGVWRNVGGTTLAAVLATLSELAVRVVLSLAEVLVRPEVTPITAADTVPPMWFLWIKALAGDIFGLWLMLMLYAAYRDVFFEPAEQNRLPENADSNEIGVD